MKLFLAMLVLAIGGVIAALVFRKLGGTGAGTSNEAWPFYAKKPLTQVEQAVYYRLVDALPEFIVLSQVSLPQVLGIKAGKRSGEWYNRIARMSYDFVVCSKDFKVVAVIEVDDKSHDRADRKQADAKKDKATADAGLKMLRWQASKLPDKKTMRETILSISTMPVAAPETEPSL